MGATIEISGVDEAGVGDSSRAWILFNFGLERSRYIFLNPVWSSSLVTSTRSLFFSKEHFGSLFSSQITPLPLSITFCTPWTAFQPPSSLRTTSPLSYIGRTLVCPPKKLYNKIKRELYSTECECFEIKFYTADRLPCFGCQMFQKWPIKLGRMYQTAHQNDGFNALRLCCSKPNPACLCYDSKPARLHKAQWAIQLLNHLLGLVHGTFKSDQVQRH